MGRKPVTKKETTTVKDSASAKKVVAEEKKTVEKKTEAAPKASTTAKKAPATTKTTTVKESGSVKTTLTVQYRDKSVTSDSILETAKDVWSKDTGKKISSLKSIELYVKPEENKVYYVANGNELGSFDL